MTGPAGEEPAEETAARERRREQLRDYRIAGPPSLRLRLGSRLKVLLVANIIPLLAAAWLGWKWSQGEVALDPAISAPALILSLGLLVGGCLVLALTGWVVLPIARWCRDYPSWHFKRRSQLLWVLPTLGGWLVWLACLLVALAALGGAVMALIIGLTRLFLQAGEVA